MVGLHVKDHEIVRCLAFQRGLEILKILVRDRDVCGVEQDGLLVLDDIAVVCDAVRQREQVLKQRESPVASADPEDILRGLVNVDHDMTSV